jgi:uncharacterized protein YqjF (DUF2071 family)
MTAPVFLTAEWRHLLMLNYQVKPDVLLPRLPRGTELDLWDGKALVSIVGFMFLHTKLKGVPIPFHQDFEEINLRFYVRRKAEDGDRRGVVFIKELVPRSAIAFVARTIYNENYASVAMQHSIAEKEGEARVSYGWRMAGRWNHIQGETLHEMKLPARGSEEEFITEHYWGYACQKDGGCMEYRVDHPQWRVAKVRAVTDADFAQTYGAEFAAALSAPPTSAFLADGSGVSVFGGARL